MSDGLEAARALLPGVRLDVVEHLKGNDRSVVDRVRGRWPDGTESSLIVKRYEPGGEGWARESAALAVIPPRVRAPRVAAAGSDPPVLVLHDLGPGPSVADALLGDDPHAAQQALHAWAQALAELHAGTRDGRDAFRAALTERERADAPVRDARMVVDLEDAVRVIDRACASLEIRVPAGAFDELRGLAKRLGGSGIAALTPADTCPDNNLLTADGLVLLDYEGAQWRHVAWDVAYLVVPWPTCWCAWRIPDAAADSAVNAYLRAAAAQLPEVAAPGFAGDVAAAATGWALISTSWFIDNALGSDPPLNPDRRTPTRRAMIQHRLDLAARTAEVPAVAELASLLGAVLRERWGDVPLALAPAFRRAQ